MITSTGARTRGAGNEWEAARVAVLHESAELSVAVAAACTPERRWCRSAASAIRLFDEPSHLVGDAVVEHCRLS
jgi:hypothetical protein